MGVRTVESEEKGDEVLQVLEMCMVVVRTVESEEKEEEKERIVSEPFNTTTTLLEKRSQIQVQYDSSRSIRLMFHVVYIVFLCSETIVGNRELIMDLLRFIMVNRFSVSCCVYCIDVRWRQ